MDLTLFTTEELYAGLNDEVFLIQASKRQKNSNKSGARVQGFVSGITKGGAMFLILLDSFVWTFVYSRSDLKSDSSSQKTMYLATSCAGVFILIVSVPIAVYYAQKKYHEYKAREQKIQLGECKMKIYDEILKREKATLPKRVLTGLEGRSLQSSSPSSIDYTVLKISAVRGGITAATALLSSYLLVSYYALNFLGFAATSLLLTSIPALAIALGIAVTIAVLASSCHYHLAKKNEEQQQRLVAVESTVKNQQQEVETVQHMKNRVVLKSQRSDKPYDFSAIRNRQISPLRFFSIPKNDEENKSLRTHSVKRRRLF